MKKPYDRPKKLRAVKTLVRVTLNDSFRIRPRTEVSSLLILQPVVPKVSTCREPDCPPHVPYNHAPQKIVLMRSAGF